MRPLQMGVTLRALQKVGRGAKPPRGRLRTKGTGNRAGGVGALWFFQKNRNKRYIACSDVSTWDKRDAEKFSDFGRKEECEGTTPAGAFWSATAKGGS